MSKRTLQSLLEDQLQIMYMIGSKLSVVNYIKDGYDNNKPVLINERFLHYIAMIFYKSLIIDFAALFGYGRNDKNRLHLIEKDYHDELSPESLNTITTLLKKYHPNVDPVKRLIVLRDKEIAHYDPEPSNDDSGHNRISIKFNWNEFDSLNELYEVGKTIILEASSSIGEGIDYRFSDGDKVRQLDRLVSDIIKGRTKK